MEPMIQYTAEEICAILTTKACSRNELPQLDFDDTLRLEVKDKLDAAGYEFVYDPISKYYDARIKRGIRSLDELIEGQLGTSELTVTAKALIAILWNLLVLPQYDRKLRNELDEEPYVTEEQLYENYKQQIGAKQNLRKVLTILRQYDFIRTVWGRKGIKAGPRLFTAIDSTLMYDKMKNYLLEQSIQENERQKRDVQKMIREQLRDLRKESEEEDDESATG